MDNWDETLRQLNHAVTVREAASRWSGDPDSLHHVQTGVNATFRFTANGAGYYLRLTHTSLIRERKVMSALNYLQHLWREGAQVCEPVPSAKGLFAETILGDTATERTPEAGQWLATVTKEAAGSPITRNKGVFDDPEAWGRCAGLLHRAARTYIPNPDDDFGGGPQEAHAVWERTGRNIPAFDALALQEYKILDLWVQNLPGAEGSPDFGLIHGDFGGNNTLWDGRTATVIDFDEPRYDWFASDFSGPIGELWWDERRPSTQERFLRGYRTACDFPAFWADNLSRLARKWALQYYAETNPYPTLESLAEADREGVDRPDDFCWRVRKRFADPSLWESG